MDFTNAERLVKAGIENKLYSGAALAVNFKGNRVYSSYFGKTSFAAEAAEVDAKTRFDLASISKIFSTTSIALRFLDKGMIRLYDKVGYFFPEATTVKDVTVLQLMTHTSGEPGSFNLAKEAGEVENVRATLLQRELKHQPGTVEEYSCMGYILLGEILKKVSGKTLDVLFQEEVCDVLQIKNSSYGPLDTSSTKVCQTTDIASGKALNGIVHDENARFQNGISANAGIFSTLDDVTLYGQTLLQHGFTAAGQSFISPATLSKAQQNYTSGLAQDRGLGFILNSSQNTSFGDLFSPEAYGHTGFTGTAILIDPNYESVVTLLTNRVINVNDGSESFRLRALTFNAIAAEISKYI